MEQQQNREWIITEYEERWHAGAQELLDELEEYLVSVDGDGLDRISERYHEEMLDHDLAELKEYGGKCFVALSGGVPAGLIIGIRRQYSDADKLDYSCPPGRSHHRACRQEGIPAERDRESPDRKTGRILCGERLYLYVYRCLCLQSRCPVILRTGRLSSADDHCR